MPPFSRRFHVGWGDLDGNAHMANTAFLDHAADVRMAFFDAHGFGMPRFAQERLGPVIVRDELDYHKELRLLDEYTVDVEAAGLSPDGVRFRLHNTFRTGDTMIARVTSEGLWFDLDKRRPRSPPTDLVAAMRGMSKSTDFAELVSRRDNETP